MIVCDPFRTPFSRNELLRIAMVSERLPTWFTPDFVKRSYIDPEDPAERLRLHNFWDVMLATCAVALIACGESLDQAHRLADAFTDLLAGIVDRGLVEHAHSSSSDQESSSAILRLIGALESGDLRSAILSDLIGMAGDPIVGRIPRRLPLLLDESLRVSRQCISLVQGGQLDVSFSEPAQYFNVVKAESEHEHECQLLLFPLAPSLSAESFPEDAIPGSGASSSRVRTH